MEDYRFINHIENQCPFCNSKDYILVDCYDEPMDASRATYEMKCGDCEATWKQHYQLVFIDKTDCTRGNQDNECKSIAFTNDELTILLTALKSISDTSNIDYFKKVNKVSNKVGDAIND